MSIEAALEAVVERVLRRVLDEKLQPEMLTPAQAGVLVGRSAKTILSWLREGLLQKHGPGRPLVSRKELLALASAPSKKRGARGVPTAEAEVHRLTRRAG